MNISIFDLFKIGIGPSSSHTVGPMKASLFFLEKLKKREIFYKVSRVKVELYGSLASTGIGHGTDKAVILGLLGETPENINTETADDIFESIKNGDDINLMSERVITFNYESDISFIPDEQLEYHPNGMKYYAYDSSGNEIFVKDFYSIGGGFIVGRFTAQNDRLIKNSVTLPYAFRSSKELIELCKKNNLSISDMVFENELFWRSEEEIYSMLDKIFDTMVESIDSGKNKSGVLPGPLKIPRRARVIYERLISHPEESLKDPLSVVDWVNLYALSVNEENASGGRIVTAPTNGAAGVIPAVLMYYYKFRSDHNKNGVYKFLLTAGAIGILYKINASISGAEVGCQGEVGVACSMAAAGLVEASGGSILQVENAAEIGMEHNLGLTCDPLCGQVQVPCIERNAMAAVKAINAARISMKGTGDHMISLDSVIETMRQTGLDMQSKYKETSKGGLAVNITEC